MIECKYLGLVQGKPSWSGRYQLQANGMWFVARSGYGAIIYATPEAALAGARVCQASDWDFHATRVASAQ